MIESERHRLMTRLVEDRSVISLAALAEAMPHVSASTIRRDVRALVESGQVRRVWGGIESMRTSPPPPVAAPQKRAIAEAGAKLIQDGESIIIAAGTTTEAIVEFLRDRELDILTNSLAVAIRLFGTSHNHVMLAGGTLLREQGVLLSPYENDCVDHFCAQKLFTSCHAIKPAGLMETDPLLLQAQRRLLSRADEIIVLADSRKFRRPSALLVASLERVSTIITDEGADDGEIQQFRRVGIEVIVARAT